jgi:hypothetical protein
VKVEDIRICIESNGKMGGWEVKGQGRPMEGVEKTKVKYTHSGDTLRNPFKH